MYVLTIALPPAEAIRPQQRHQMALVLSSGMVHFFSNVIKKTLLLTTMQTDKLTSLMSPAVLKQQVATLQRDLHNLALKNSLEQMVAEKYIRYSASQISTSTTQRQLKRNLKAAYGYAENGKLHSHPPPFAQS
jgi:hypothetical protein